MATDNMDLSFIKCPACQSLAPAISKRCRMCGASLHAEGDEAGAQQKKSGRVRQRTVSSQAGDVGEALSEVRGSFVPPSKVPPSVAQEAPDPLGAYLAEDDFEAAPQPEAVGAANGGGVKASHFEEPTSMSPEPVPEPRREPERQREVAQLVESVARTTPTAPQLRPTKTSSPRREEVSGRLIGWLVSYEDPAGSAFEIREGKFFVSRTQIKGQADFIIDNESISSPHAMLRSSPGKLMVQDLMSERGVFRRPRGTEVYRPEEESFALEHGDWVRFGDVEYLVSLVAHVGEV